MSWMEPKNQQEAAIKKIFLVVNTEKKKGNTACRLTNTKKTNKRKNDVGIMILLPTYITQREKKMLSYIMICTCTHEERQDAIRIITFIPGQQELQRQGPQQHHDVAPEDNGCQGEQPQGSRHVIPQPGLRARCVRIHVRADSAVGGGAANVQRNFYFPSILTIGNSE